MILKPKPRLSHNNRLVQRSLLAVVRAQLDAHKRRDVGLQIEPSNDPESVEETEVAAATPTRNSLIMPFEPPAHFSQLKLFSLERKQLARQTKEESVVKLNYNSLVHFGELAHLPYLIFGKNRYSLAWKFLNGSKFEHVAEPDLVAQNLAINDFVTICSEVRFSQEDSKKRPWLGQICGEALSVAILPEILNRDARVPFNEWSRPLAFIVQAGLQVGLIFIQFRRVALLDLINAVPNQYGDQSVYRVFNVVTGSPQGLHWSNPDDLLELTRLYRLTGKFGNLPTRTAVRIADAWSKEFPLVRGFEGVLEMK